MRENGDARLCYVTCACGDRIKAPHVRTSGPVRDLHHRGFGDPCRIVVTPDPVGDSHQVELVPRGVSLEAALSRALDEWMAEMAEAR